MNWKYWMGALATLPVLPVLYVQATRVKASIPDLPEARGPKGQVATGAKRNLRIINVGESTVAGVGVATHEEGFAGTLARLLAERLSCNVSWQVYARSGYTARMTTELILPQIDNTPADLIVVGLGGNDTFKLNTPQRWVKDLRQLIAGLQKKFPGRPIVFTNMPPVGEFPAFTPLMQLVFGQLIMVLGEELVKLADEEKGVFAYSERITLERWLTRLEEGMDSSVFFSDGVHPSKLTYQLLAQDVGEYILKERILQ